VPGAAARRRLVVRHLALVAAAALLAPGTAAAQLRPLEPIPWTVFSGGRTLALELGVSHLIDQRASLAGTTGALSELPNFALAWRLGRIALEVGGTGLRDFREESRFAASYADVAPATGGRRRDSGDLRIATAVAFTPEGAAITGVARFGARLPTTDNMTGLDRDATDLFLTVGARSASPRFAIAAEAGLGVFGTREPRFEQEDLLLYAARAEWRAGAWTPSIGVLGQMHARTHPSIRGTEHLGEVRIGVRLGERRWVRVEGVRGFSTFSPELGVLVTAGLNR